MKRPSFNRQFSEYRIPENRRRNENFASNGTTEVHSIQKNFIADRGSAQQTKKDDSTECSQCAELRREINFIWKIISGNVKFGVGAIRQEKPDKPVDGGEYDHSRSQSGLGWDGLNVEHINVGFKGKALGKVQDLLHVEKDTSKSNTCSRFHSASPDISANENNIRSSNNGTVQPNRREHCTNKVFLQSATSRGCGGAETPNGTTNTIPLEQATKESDSIGKHDNATVLESCLPLDRDSKFNDRKIRTGDLAKNSNRLGQRNKGVALQPVATINVHSNSWGRHSGACPIRSYAQVVEHNVPNERTTDGSKYQANARSSFWNTFSQERGGHGAVQTGRKWEGHNRRTEESGKTPTDRIPPPVQFRSRHYRARSWNWESDNASENVVSSENLFRQYLRDMPQEKSRYTIVRTRRTTKLAMHDDLKLPLHVKKVKVLNMNEVRNMMNGAASARFCETLNTLFKLEKNEDESPKFAPTLPEKDIKELEDANIISKVSPDEENKRPTNQWVIPFTVIEPADETGVEKRRRFIAWTREDNKRLKEDYIPYVPLKHAAFYLHRAKEPYGLKRDLSCGFYQVSVPEQARAKFRFRGSNGDLQGWAPSEWGGLKFVKLVQFWKVIAHSRALK